MAKVLLQNNWFGVDGRRYRKDPYGFPVEIADDLVPHLPSSARVVSMDDGSEPPVFAPRTPFKIPPFTGNPILALRRAAAQNLDSRPKAAPAPDVLRAFDEVREEQGLVEKKLEEAENRQADELAERRRKGLEKARAARAAKKAAKAE